MLWVRVTFKFSQKIAFFCVCAIKNYFDFPIFTISIYHKVTIIFSDGQIQIRILIAKDIFYKYKYEYYSWHLVSRIWIRILIVKNIHKYIQIFENHQTSGYCYLPVWRFWIWYQNLFFKLSILFVLTIIGEFGV